jgi:type III pantothenate kinase
MTPFLAVDIGNSAVKVGLAETLAAGATISWQRFQETATEGFAPELLRPMLPAVSCQWRVACVQRAAEDKLSAWVRQHRPADDYHVLTYRDLPLRVNVKSPALVGVDRLAAAVAANRLRSADRPAIVITAGTALTVNLVDSDGVFQGGVILPGFHLIARALAAGTDLLPAVDTSFHASPPPQVIGKSTEEAIRSGLFWGGVGAIRELVGRLNADLASSPQLFVTGGDANLLVKFLSADAVFISDLVLQGIALASAK